MGKGPKIGSQQWIILTELIRMNVYNDQPTPVPYTKLKELSQARNLPATIKQLTLRGNEIDIAYTRGGEVAYTLIKVDGYQFAD